MKILFLADNFPPEKNAQASRVYERARYWVKWGHEVTVITCAPNFPEGRVYTGYRNRFHQVERIDGIRVVRVGTFIAANTGTVLRIVDFVSYMFASLWAGLFEVRPDIIVATSPQFFAAVAGWALARVRRLPFVFELSDLWPDSIVAVGAMKANVGLRYLEKFELFLYRQSAAVVALTYAFKKNLVRRGIAEQKIFVVRNGVELEAFQPRARAATLRDELHIAEDEIVFGYMGTLGMAHGLNNVLEAAELLVGKQIRFLLVGPGAEREKLVDEANRRKIHNVTFVPPQPKQRMSDYWSICDVALVHLKDSPLFATVIPSKLFEAMGMGLPILLAAPSGEASEIVAAEGAGLCIPPGEPIALAQAAQLLSGDKRLRETLAEASRGAAPRYSRERQAFEMLGCLKKALPAMVLGER